MSFTMFTASCKNYDVERIIKIFTHDISIALFSATYACMYDVLCMYV